MTPLTPIITAHWDVPDYFTLEGYRRFGGYSALPKALDQHIAAFGFCQVVGRFNFGLGAQLE